MSTSKAVAKRKLISDEAAYWLPMVVFLLITAAGVQWPSIFPASYILKTILVGALLLAFWSRYTPIRWNYAAIGVLLGIVGAAQWIGMEKLIQHFFPNYPHASGASVNPFTDIHSVWLRTAFLAARLAGPVLVVPFMEERFWRDFAWRTAIAPNDFRLAEIGEWDWQAFLIVTALFASVHPFWITAIVWGAMIAGLLVRTRSLGACILMHATTNLLLGVYVMWTHDWSFW